MRIYLTISLLFPALVSAAPGDFNLAATAAVVKIHAHAPHQLFVGSGVYLSPDEVITNCHVTRNAHSITVIRGAILLRATAQKSDPQHDLCLLKTAATEVQPVLTVPSSTVKIGDPVYFFGFSGGAGAMFADGQVAALHEYDGGGVIETTTGFGLGASGGGVFDPLGRLLGIATFFTSVPRGHYFATPTEWLEPLRNLPWQAIEPRLGTAFWELPEAHRPFFLRALQCVHQGDWRQLRDIASVWQEHEPFSAEAWLMLGQAAVALGEPDTARHSLQRAVALQPRYDEAWYHLALLDAELGRRDSYTHAQRRLAGLNRVLANKLDQERMCNPWC